MTAEPAETRITLRLPARLAARLANLSDDARRSRNSQIILLLEQALRKDPQP